jgi:hypothetical protein
MGSERPRFSRCNVQLTDCNVLKPRADAPPQCGGRGLTKAVRTSYASRGGTLRHFCPPPPTAGHSSIGSNE